MNLIITTLSDKKQQYINYFYEYIVSLRDTGYKDDILVLLYGTFNDELFLFLKKNKVLFNIKKESEIINNQRIIDIYNMMNILNYDRFLITDVDIWFQDSIYSLFNKMNDKFIYTSDIPINQQIIGLEYQNIFKDKQDEINSIDKYNDIIHNNKTIINCGVFGARKDVLINKLNQYINFSQKTYNIYGLDTIIFNSIYNQNEDIILKYKYNYLSKQKPKLIDGMYYTHEDEKIVIIHNAGSVAKKNIYSYKKV